MVLLINVPVNVGGGVKYFCSYYYRLFETGNRFSNVPSVDASYAANTLTIQSNTGDAVSVVRTNVGSNW